MTAAATPPAPWNEQHHALWQRIAAHPLGFAAKLARETGWSANFTQGAIAEYRRFCFLAMVSPQAVTPSEEVDAVWHAHLLHSRDYWDAWCAETLGARLHHEPTTGAAELAKFRAQYAQTMACYESWFGPPPEQYWPATWQRFNDETRFRAVDRARAWVLPRPRLPRWRWVFLLPLALASVLAGPAAAQALPANPLDWPGPFFLQLYLVLLGLAGLAAILLRRSAVRDAAGMPAEDLTPVELAYLAGGHARACDAALVGLMQHGAALLNKARLYPSAATHPLPAWLAPFQPCLRLAGMSRPDFIRAARGVTKRIAAGLAGRGQVVAPGAARRAALISALPLLALIAFGMAKLAIGLERDRPVGLLLVLLILSLALALCCALAPPRLTQAGRATRAAWKARTRRLRRAPQEDELPLAVAIGGVLVLRGSPFADYLRIAAPDGGGADGSGSGGSGCSGGGGGGGGGCGGCSA